MIRYLCNGSWAPHLHAHSNVSILILEGDQEWETAYQRWLAGKNPTDSPHWKRGVILSFTNTTTAWSFKAQ